jgi:hypothetical protein
MAWRACRVKLRLKWLAPHGPTGAFWGANLEVESRPPARPESLERRIEADRRLAQRSLGAGRQRQLRFRDRGAEPRPITLDIDTKAGYRLTPLTVGVESYNEVGPLRDPGHFGNTEHSTYAAVDAQIGKWDLNAAVGKGYGANADSVIVKFIIGVPI